MRRLVYIAALLAIASPASAETIAGRASVIDGDTPEIHGERVRILDIDAPESNQPCKTGDGTLRPCSRCTALALSETPVDFDLAVHCRYERAEAELPPPPRKAESYSTPSFANRAAGALFSNGFDEQPPTGTKGNTHAVFMNGGLASNINPVMPHVVYSQDGEGALQMDFLSESNSGASGQYWVHFPETIDLGQTVHIQWRQRFNAGFVETQFKRRDNGGNTAPKLIIVSRTTSSCQNVEVAVTSTTGVTKAPTMYNNCNFFTQIPRLVTWPYPIDTWITFNLTLTKPTSKYQSGRFFYYDTHVVLQTKPDGREVVTIVDAIQPMRAMDIPWDAAFFTPYITKKDPAQVHPTASVWIDEVIISKDPIPFP